MKTRLGVLLFVLLTGMILGVTQPALVYAGGETGGGTLWDPFVNVSFFKLIPTSWWKGTYLTGTLSICYEPLLSQPLCSNSNYQATMFYTVRLIQGEGSHQQILTFEGDTTQNTPPTVCLGDVGTPGSGGQGDVIMHFLKTAVLTFFPSATDAQITSVVNVGIATNSLGYIADITVVVKK